LFSRHEGIVIAVADQNFGFDLARHGRTLRL
jgi:hypothetical protein